MTNDAPHYVAVRIGDVQLLASDSGARLVTVGLGSCVGVAIIDLQRGTAALAHVFLPEQPVDGPRDGAGPGTYADVAIPELVRRLHAAAGTRTTRQLVAVIAGGACMFAGRTGADVGERNAAAVRAALRASGVELVAEDVGGTRGRTMRVAPGPAPVVSVRLVGGTEQEIWTARRATREYASLLRAA